MNGLAFFNNFFGRSENNGDRWSHVQTYPPQTEIYHQGDAAEGVYLIECGVVKLTRSASNGKEIITDIRRRSWLIGTTAVVLGTNYSNTVVTLTPSSLRFIPANVFLDLLKKDGELSRQIIFLLSLDVVKERKGMEVIGCMSARERLEYLFCELMLEQEPPELHRSAEFPVSLRNQELAEIIAVTPEHLCRVLKEMERSGVIRRSKGTVRVTDCMGLLERWEARDICPEFDQPLVLSRG